MCSYVAMIGGTISSRIRGLHLNAPSKLWLSMSKTQCYGVEGGPNHEYIMIPTLVCPPIIGHQDP